MSEEAVRMLDRDHPPSDPDVRDWIGQTNYERWQQLKRLIDQRYPNAFAPEWLYGGKHGWSLRYKKGKSFCTLIPEKNRFAVLIIFGAEERTKVATIREHLSKEIQKTYDDAKTYHDGKWVVLCVDTDQMVQEIIQLLAVKRRPKNIEGDRDTFIDPT